MARSEPTFNGFRGINNTTKPERVKSMPSKDDSRVDLVEAVNVDLDNTGALSRRSGLTMKIAGAAHSLWADGRDCFFVKNGTMYRMLADFTATEVVAGIGDTTVNYVKVADRIYYSNGVTTGCIEGEHRTWGLPMPQSPALSVIEGSMDGGWYSVQLTFLRADGQESGSALTSRILLADGQGMRVSWQDRPSEAVGANVYASTPNGMVTYLVASTAVEMGNVDITLPPRMATPLATEWMDPPPPGQCLGYSNGRIYIGQGPYLFATVALGYELCDLRDYLAIDGSRIQFVTGMQGGLFVGTEMGVYFLSGNRLDAMSLRQCVYSPAVKNSGVIVDAGVATGNPEMAGRRAVLFAASAGIYMGMEDGSVIAMTGDRYEVGATSSGAAGFRNDEDLKQYILFMS